jgi:hypothetical protein
MDKLLAAIFLPHSGVKISHGVPVAILGKSGRSNFSHDDSAATATASCAPNERGELPTCFVGRQPIKIKFSVYDPETNTSVNLY